jgi:hypothetical protein
VRALSLSLSGAIFGEFISFVNHIDYLSGLEATIFVDRLFWLLLILWCGDSFRLSFRLGCLRLLFLFLRSLYCLLESLFSRLALCKLLLELHITRFL